MKHLLQGRHESEILWYQRREFIQGAAAFIAMGTTLGGAKAQESNNVVTARGDILVNNAAWQSGQNIQTGDRIETGENSQMIFSIGNSAFHVRQNSEIIVGRGNSLNAVSLLRLLTGAVVSVWGRGSSRRIVTPTLTAGIRGTGVYTEVMDETRTYFCNCYGTVDLSAMGQSRTTTTRYHEPFWANEGDAKQRFIRPAPPINHGDEELEFLAKLVDQKTAWQIWGKGGAHHQDDAHSAVGAENSTNASTSTESTHAVAQGSSAEPFSEPQVQTGY